MRKLLTIIILLSYFLFSGIAYADYTINTATSNADSIGYIGYSTTNSEYGAQSFTTTAAGTVDITELCVFKANGSPTGGVDVELRADDAGTPDENTLIDSGSIAHADIPASQGMATVTGLTGVSLSASTVYWLVISNTSGGVSTSNNYGGCGTLTSTYAGGEWLTSATYPAWNTAAVRDMNSTIVVTEGGGGGGGTSATTTPDGTAQVTISGFFLFFVTMFFIVWSFKKSRH